MLLNVDISMDLTKTSRAMSLWALPELPRARHEQYRLTASGRQYAGAKRAQRVAGLHEAVVVLQALIRGVLRRIALKREWIQRFCKCFDAYTGFFYFFDKHTGESRWHKPELIRGADLQLSGTGGQTTGYGFLIAISMCR
jgi:hypothetical protein